MNPMKTPLSVLAIATLCTTAHAATVAGSVATATNNTIGTAYVMPSGAGTDWGIFVKDNNPVSGPLNATNTSNTGARVFGVSAFNGGSIRGPGDLTTGAPFSYFSYSNGTTPASPVAGTDARPSGIFNSQLGNAGATAGPDGDKGAGVQLSVTGISSQSIISVWLFNFSSAGYLEVFLNGSSTASYTQTVASADNPPNGKNAYLLNLDFTPDSTADELLIRYRMTSSADFAHVGFQAIAISPIPEPASLALLATAAGIFGLRRRRI